jgi:predicted  nucleic acid-binding Zn-ribbon protein
MRINSMIVKNCGPLRELTVPEFKNITCIYGKNEQGKSFLTEFIAKTLFKNSGIYGDLRIKEAQGKISVSSINDEETVLNFKSGKGEKKLDQLFDQNKISPSLSRLLLVSGGNAELKDLNADTIGQIFSMSRIYDIIDSDVRISKTIKGANSLASINNKGEGDSYSKINDRLGKVEDVINKISTGIDLGKIKGISEQISILKKQQEEMNIAKRFYASALHNRIKILKGRRQDLQISLEKLTKDDLKMIERDISDYELKKEELRGKTEKFNMLEAESRYYNEIDNASSNYSNLLQLQGNKKDLSSVYLYILPVIFIVGLILMYFDMKIPGSVLMILPAVYAVYSYMKNTRSKAQDIKSEEISIIEKRYLELTGEKLSGGIAQLVSLKDKLQRKKIDGDNLENEIGNIKNDISARKQMLTQKLKEITMKNIEEENWQENIGGLNENMRAIDIEMKSTDKDIFDLNGEYARLNISVTDFISEEPAMRYSESALKDIIDKIIELEKRLQDERKSFDDLKYSLISITSSENTAELNEMIEKLYKVRDSIKKELDEIKIKILAGIAVHKTIEELRLTERDALNDSIDSGCTSRYISLLTGNIYKRIYVGAEGDIIISNDTSDININDLSTGTKEQVYLAIRIGFIKKILGNEGKAFLILDDAFQHSDWERREILTGNLIKLAGEGWQIIYLTMDDHIKELFNKKSAEIKDEYQFIDLAGYQYL